MKAKIKTKLNVEIKYLDVKAGVRYWEDSTVNGVEDETGELIPCRLEDYWCPSIDIDKGQIVNWSKGTVADIHYKVCDDGEYKIRDYEGNVVLEIDGYVPNTMSPKEDGFGDYIIMEVDENGFIKDWAFDITDFNQSNDYDNV